VTGGLLTLSEAADRFSVNISAVKRLVADGQLPTVRVGRSVRPARHLPYDAWTKCVRWTTTRGFTGG